MQGEIVVALISTVGATVSAVGVALLARGRAPGGDHQFPLLSIGSYCGRVRGAATAAQRDCEEALARIRGGRAPARTARLRDRIFEEARFREVLSDAYRFDVHPFNQEIDRFRDKLRRVGERIDVIAEAGEGAPATRRAELADAEKALRAMTSLFNAVDEQFGMARTRYFDRQVSRPSRRTERRLRKRAEKRYRRSAKRGEADMIARLPLIDAGFSDQDDTVPPQTPGPAPEGVTGATAPASAPAEPPPCGYCIWRCPHAPTATDTGGGRGTAALSGG
ncbi:hypothetical protein [Streptomyces adustus]|uniref:hypothetical protein n=1 Tax=Streptomyces adustus TaxID=1609272 RepID=UPI00371CFC51